jgi:predicted ATP-binding protein involved in virulence
VSATSVPLHHPGWQQRILPDLLRTFPNVQFVVTTHSHQVLSSVPTKHIRTIDADGNIASTSCKLHGAESKRVLEELMQVSSRPTALANEIQEFVRITDAGDWTSSSYQKLRAKLLSELGNSDPVIIQTEIKRQFQSLETMEDDA